MHGSNDGRVNEQNGTTAQGGPLALVAFAFTVLGASRMDPINPHLILPERCCARLQLRDSFLGEH